MSLMMQSIAMNESSYCNDDDYVVVELQGAAAQELGASDQMSGIVGCDDNADDESYDYCDDALYGAPLAALGVDQQSTTQGARGVAVLVEDSDTVDVDSPDRLAEDSDLLDVASSMLQEEIGWETELDNYRYGDDNGVCSMQVSATELDFAMPTSNDDIHQEANTTQLTGHMDRVIDATDVSPSDTPTETKGSSVVSTANNDVADAAKHGGSGSSRPCNKKRRKQLKMAKKAATAAYLAQLALNDPRSATTMSHSIARTSREINQGPQQPTATCGSHSIDEGCRVDGVSTSNQSLFV